MLRWVACVKNASLVMVRVLSKRQHLLKKQKVKLMAKKNNAEPKPKGRPSNYTPELGQRICAMVATHPIGYDHIQKMYPDLPLKGVVTAYRKRFPAFNAEYLAAKSFQSEIMVEEIDEMIPSEIKYYIDDKGNERIDAPSASLAIARVNNRKWTAARLAPRVYGDAKRVEDLEGQNSALTKELIELRKQMDEKNKKDF